MIDNKEMHELPPGLHEGGLWLQVIRDEIEKAKERPVALIAFVVYSVLYELIIWGVFGYAVFVLGHSGWWLMLAVGMSASQIPSGKFGIKTLA